MSFPWRVVCGAVLFFVISGVFAGCITPQPERDYGSARAFFDRGDYHNAVVWAVAALKGKPDYEEAAILLREAAPLAYQQHQERALSYEIQGNWSSAHDEYETLLALSRQVRSLQRDFPTLEESELLTARESAACLAAEQHYTEGLAYLGSGQFKQAALEFQAANRYIPDYEDSLELYESARARATQRVLIMPFQYVDRWDEFAYLGELVTDKLLATMVREDLEFTEFVSELYLRRELEESSRLDSRLIEERLWELGERAGVDVFVCGKVFPVQVHSFWPAGAVLGYKNYPARVPGVEKSNTVTISPSEGDPYTITAHWVERKLVNSVAVTVSYTIAETATQSVEHSRVITRENADEVRWADSFSGEERALPHGAKSLLRQGVQYPKLPTFLAEECISQVADEIARVLAANFSD